MKSTTRNSLAGLAIAMSSISGASAAEVGEPIKIGVIQPQQGDCATWGIPMTRAVNLWAEEFNDEGGFLAGDGKLHPIEVSAYDNNCYSAGDELIAARRAVLNDGVSYLVHTYTPASRQAIASLITENGVFATSYGAGFLSAEFPNLSGGMTGSPMSNMLLPYFMSAQNPDVKRIAILTGNSSFGQAARAYVEAGLAARGDEIEVVYNESFDPAASSDMLGLLTPIIQAKPDMIYQMGLPPSGAAVFLATADQLGYTGIFGSESWDTTFLQQQGLVESAAGRIFTGIGVDAAEPEFSPRAHAFYNRFVEKHGQESWSPWSSTIYSALGLFEAGWNSTDGVDAVDVMNTVYAMDEVDHPIYGKSGWSGNDIYGADHHLLTPLPIYGLAADGSTTHVGTVDAAAWWEEHGSVALPVLESRGQVYAN